MAAKPPAIPKSVRVGPYTFRVYGRGQSWVQSNGAYGNTITDSLEINVASCFSPLIVLDTLIHEIMHAIYYAYHLDERDDEERTVATIATAWVGVLRDNPAFVMFQQAVLADYHE